MTCVTLGSSMPSFSSNSTSAARSRIQPGTCIHPRPTPDLGVGEESEGTGNEMAATLVKLEYCCSIDSSNPTSFASLYTSPTYRTSWTVLVAVSCTASRDPSTRSPTKHNLVLISSTTSSESRSIGILLAAWTVVLLSELGGET